jgi:hypothetical protein
MSRHSCAKLTLNLALMIAELFNTQAANREALEREEREAEKKANGVRRRRDELEQVTALQQLSLF